jgi:hypothetical protein
MRNRKLKQAIAMVAIGFASSATGRAATAVYDFDNGQVTGSASPGTPLVNSTVLGTVGQDNWVLTSGSSSVVRTDPTPGFTNNYISSPVVTTTSLDGIMTRKNDANFSYSLGSSTQLVMTFDTTVGIAAPSSTLNRRGEIALGVDVNDDGKIRPTSAASENAEIAFMFGYEATGPGWYVRPAAFGTAITAVATPSGTWRAQLVVDLAANSNNGSGSLYIKQLFDGSGNAVNDVFHAADPSLLNVNLGIQRMATITGGAPYAADPANWNGLMARTAGNGSIDNISISTDPLTAPPQWALNNAGSWTNSANWYPATAPNGIGAEATFGSIISSNRSVFADTPVTAGTLHLNNPNSYVLGGAGSLTMQTASGSALIDVQAGTQKISLPLIIASDTNLSVASGATLKISNPLTVNSGKTLSQSGSGAVVYESTVTVQSGGSILFGNSGHLASLSVASTGSAGLTTGNNKTLRVDSLSLAGKLDLKDNRLITPASVGSWTGSAYTGVTGSIQSGRNGGGWGGASGIVTSQTQATTSSITSIGVATGSQAKGIGSNQTAAWNGQTVSGSDTLVMYTYGGDANLDGKINVDDYTRIDFNVPLGASGWFNGDFNYDGKINVDDYTIIDFNVGIQGAPLGGASGLSAVAVPEPATVSVMVLGAASLLGRRRRK